MPPLDQLDPDKIIQELFVYDPARPLLFNSAAFLFLFLGFFSIYLLVANHKTLRSLWVIAFSIFFYYKCSGIYFYLLLLSTVVDFFLGYQIAFTPFEKWRKIYLWTSILFNLGMLAYFKYTNFFITTFSSALDQDWHTLDIFLPVGISFFTFQTMSYTIDVYRRKLEPTHSFWDYAFFVTFFPQLVAGPIVRAAEFLPQIKETITVKREDISRGLLLICGGLFKKAIISDYIAINFVDRVFDNPALYSGFENLMGVYGYALQIYCDFSGYSDIAIGIGLLLGFRLPDNFDAPYQSGSIQEFWRRWHISLSSWLRDYLYISLGGNRQGRWRTYLNLMLTMLLGGLWHGASWTFVFWGFLHGLALGVERFFSRSSLISRFQMQHQSRLFRLLRVLFTFHFVCLCWIFFRAADFGMAGEMIGQIVGNFHPEVAWQLWSGYPTVFLLMVLGYGLHFAPTLWDERWAIKFQESPVWVKALALAFIVWLVIQTRSAEVRPFIYFQF